jgi:hypothetical protein
VYGKKLMQKPDWCRHINRDTMLNNIFPLKKKPERSSYTLFLPLFFFRTYFLFSSLFWSAEGQRCESSVKVPFPMVRTTIWGPCKTYPHQTNRAPNFLGELQKMANDNDQGMYIHDHIVYCHNMKSSKQFKKISGEDKFPHQVFTTATTAARYCAKDERSTSVIMIQRLLTAEQRGIEENVSQAIFTQYSEYHAGVIVITKPTLLDPKKRAVFFEPYFYSDLPLTTLPKLVKQICKEFCISEDVLLVRGQQHGNKAVFVKPECDVHKDTGPKDERRPKCNHQAEECNSNLCVHQSLAFIETICKRALPTANNGIYIPL